MTDERLAQIEAATKTAFHDDSATLLTMCLGKACDELIAEVRRLKQSADNYRLASLGMFDPVKVGQVVAQLQMERDEARAVARALLLMAQERTGSQFVSDHVLESNPWLKG